MERPLPPRDGTLNADFWAEVARAGRLVFQRCDACDSFRHPPRTLCAGCGSEAFRWAPSTERGEIFTWTVTHQAMYPVFAKDVPYAVVVTELEEGVRLVSGLRDLDPAGLRLGLPVEVVLEPAGEGLLLPYVRPRT